MSTIEVNFNGYGPTPVGGAQKSIVELVPGGEMGMDVFLKMGCREGYLTPLSAIHFAAQLVSEVKAMRAQVPPFNMGLARGAEKRVVFTTARTIIAMNGRFRLLSTNGDTLHDAEAKEGLVISFSPNPLVEKFEQLKPLLAVLKEGGEEVVAT